MYIAINICFLVFILAQLLTILRSLLRQNIEQKHKKTEAVPFQDPWCVQKYQTTFRYFIPDSVTHPNSFFCHPTRSLDHVFTTIPRLFSHYRVPNRTTETGGRGSLICVGRKLSFKITRLKSICYSISSKTFSLDPRC